MWHIGQDSQNEIVLFVSVFQLIISLEMRVLILIPGGRCNYKGNSYKILDIYKNFIRIFGFTKKFSYRVSS